MDPIPLQSDPLEKLPELLNTVLIQIGKAFRDASSRDPKAAIYSKERVQRVIPQANREFHDALDEIEIDILKAKSVMERDLAVLRAKRAEREKAAGIQRLRESSGEAMKALGSPSVAADAIDAVMDGSDETTKVELSNSEDILMLDEPLEPTTDALNPTISTTSLDARDTKTHDEARNDHFTEDVTSSEEKRLEASKATPSSSPTKETPHQIITQEITFNPLDPSPLETPTTANLRDATFESMFNDTELAGPQDSSLDFDLDFSTDAHVNVNVNGNVDQDLLNDNNNPFGNHNAMMGSVVSTATDFSNLQSTSNEDINTLLPGLENYVNAADAFSMIDLQAPTTTTGGPTFDALNPPTTQVLPAGNNQTVVVDGTTTTATGTAPVVEQSYEDMFFGSGQLGMGMGSTDDTDMGGDENIGDFGEFDDWFKADAS